MTFRAASAVLLATLLLVPAAALADDRPALGDLSTLSDADRVRLVPTLTKEEIAKIVDATPVEVLVSIGRRAAAGLGTYRVTMTKQEKVRGKLLPFQVSEATIRPTPFAATIYYEEGPAKGRRVFYDQSMRPKELRVREHGLMGMFAIWIAYDGSLAKGDTNHTVRELGFAALLDIFGRDVDLAAPLGGFDRVSEGFDGHGYHCTLYKAPPGSAKAYSLKTRVCFDPALGLPMIVQSYDKDGLFEDVQFSKVVPNIPLAPDYFTPATHGL